VSNKREQNNIRKKKGRRRGNIREGRLSATTVISNFPSNYPCLFVLYNRWQHNVLQKLCHWSQAWCPSVNPTLGRLQYENRKFQVSLGYKGRPCLTKKKRKRKKERKRKRTMQWKQYNCNSVWSSLIKLSAFIFWLLSFFPVLESGISWPWTQCRTPRPIHIGAPRMPLPYIHKPDARQNSFIVPRHPCILQDKRDLKILSKYLLILL
jgi:hypothetical protein